MKTNRVLGHIRRTLPWFIGTIMLTAAEGYTKSSAQYLIKNITDEIASGAFVKVPFYALCAIGLHIACIIFSLAASGVETYITQKFAAVTRVELFSHISRVPHIELEKFKTGDLQSVFRNDIEQASRMFELSCFFISLFFLLAFEVFFLAAINARLTFIVFMASVIIGLITQNFLKSIKSFETASRTDLGAMSHSVIDMYNAADTIKMYSSQGFVTRLFNLRRDSYNKNLLGSSMSDMLRLILYIALNNGALFGCVIYLCFAAIRGEATIGEVLAYSALLNMMLAHIDNLFRRLAPLMASIAAWERVKKLFDIPVPDGASQNAVPSKLESITLSNISFGYNAEKYLLKNLSLNFKKGMLYALTGGSGSGKTTLLKILLGFYHAPGMIAEIDGHNAEAGLSGMVGYVPSDNRLFNISIYENIALGDISVTREKCFELAGRIGFREWLESLPDGLDTIVHENAQNLSGGQRQALCVIRALAAERPVLIMDEPFAALDANKETALLDMLSELKENRILLVTSHRISSIENCDVVIDITCQS